MAHVISENWALRASASGLELLAGILSVPLSSLISDVIKDLLHCPKGAQQTATPTRQLAPGPMPQEDCQRFPESRLVGQPIILKPFSAGAHSQNRSGALPVGPGRALFTVTMGTVTFIYP